MRLYSQQEEALKSIRHFLKNEDSIFILKGYAGTGKTTLVKSMIPVIMEFGKKVFLMAPTGRAAKILHEKTGYDACTIHRGIYAFDKMQAVRFDENGQIIETNHTDKGQVVRSKGSDDLQFWFSIKRRDSNDNPANNVYIIDESSMISSRPVCNETLHFGSDILIDDLLTYAQPHLGGKVIFVGDPAQLPPVGDNQSMALEESYFKEKNLSVTSFELTEVLRQDGESTILKNAMQIRDLLNADNRNQLTFERKEGEVEDITPEQIVDSFYEYSPIPNIGNSIILCYTNSSVKDYNDALRRHYFPGNSHVMVGDILQVVRNNINTKLGVEYYNGDFVRVLEVSEKSETLSAPVWTDVNGSRERVVLSVDFRDAVLQKENGTQTHCKIVDTLLDSRNANLTPLQNVALYINFRMRHPQLKPNEEPFKDALMQDAYFNAVQVKYGYAITGHKSQGGEWRTAFVDYSGRTGLSDDSLRWAYTATTRASTTLFGANMPNITPLSVLKFKPISKIGKLSKEAFSYAEMDDVEFLPPTATPFQKQKCVCVKEQLDTEGFFLKSIQSLQYNDRYTIEVPSGTVVVDCYYNGAGLYTSYLFLNILPENDKLKEILENESGMRYNIKYKPSNGSLEQLFEKMKSICDEFDITITNIVEHTSQYNVSYYMKTTGKFAQILFYFNSNKTITHALPSSELGAKDKKLELLIQSFQQ